MLLSQVIYRDTRANQPAATTVPAGTIYCVTDEGNIQERSNASAWQSFSSPASGKVLLEQHTASTSASLNFTTGITSTYDEYEVELIQIVPATNSVNILLRVSTNGGSSYDSGSNYSWAGFRSSAIGSASAGSSGTTSIGLDASGTQSNSSTTGGLNGSFRIFNPLGGSMYTRFTGNIGINDGTGNPDVTIILSGSYKSTTAVNAFQILASSGNLTSGTIRLYGIKK